MPYSTKLIRISQLVLDQANSRLRNEQPSQQAAQLAMASLVGDQVINIAEDIVENGLDPITLSAVVRDTSVSRKRYITLEGNRRLLALKALETPEIIESALTTGRRRRLQRAAEIFRFDPIKQISCVLFDTPEEAWYWIELRHTGENNGVGLVRWGSDEQDRFRSRHGRSATRNPAGQIIDFVDTIEPPAPGANSKILSNLSRFVSTPTVRSRLGIETEKGVVYSQFPAHEVYKGLRKVVLELRANDVRVGDIYYEDDRLEYLKSFSEADLPREDSRLSERVALANLPTEGVLLALRHEGSTVPDASEDEPTFLDQVDSPPEGVESEDEGEAAEAQEDSADDGGDDSVPPNNADTSEQSETFSEEGSPAEEAAEEAENDDEPVLGDESTDPTRDLDGGTRRRSRAKLPQERPFVIPRGVILYIPEPRPNVIYDELRKMRVDEFPNAAAVLLRVFVELSVDSYIAYRGLMSEEDRRKNPLAKRLKTVAEDLRKVSKIDVQLEKAMIKVADGTGPLGTSTTTFNQYVHNQFVFPNPREVLSAWDEMQPLLVQMWSRS